jgi:hypothetical protein
MRSPAGAATAASSKSSNSAKPRPMTSRALAATRRRDPGIAIARGLHSAHRMSQMGRESLNDSTPHTSPNGAVPNVPATMSCVSCHSVLYGRTAREFVEDSMSQIGHRSKTRGPTRAKWRSGEWCAPLSEYAAPRGISPRAGAAATPRRGGAHDLRDIPRWRRAALRLHTPCTHRCERSNVRVARPSSSTIRSV